MCCLQNRTEQLKQALCQTYMVHQDLLHPEVLVASQALDEEIVRWLRTRRERSQS